MKPITESGYHLSSMIRKVCKKMAIETMRTPNTNNVRFILTEIKAVTTHQSLAPATPDPPTLLTSNTNDIDLAMSSTSPESKVKRSLTYEETGNT